MTGLRHRAGFITFEGGEGAGKSTQVERLAERLVRCGHEVVATREPGGSPRAERIRAALLSGKVAPLGAQVEALMFAAARLDHMETLIGPALERGAFVVCDRFIDSTRAYQGSAGRTAEALIGGLERAAIGDRRPDLTLLLDLLPGEGLGRARRRREAGEPPDRFEAEGQGFHARLRAAFLDIAAREPRRIVVIDASAPPDAVADHVWRAVAGRFAVLGGDAEAPAGERSA